MAHGGDIYRNKVKIDFSVSLLPQPVPAVLLKTAAAALQHAGEYPDPEQEAVRRAIAAANGIPETCVIAGNGASELLMAAAAAVAPRKALLIEPCYSGYRHALQAVPGCEIKTHFLREENGFALTEDVVDEIMPDIGMLFLTDPWNPTGRNIDGTLLQKILDKAAAHHVYTVLDQSFLGLSEEAVRRESTAALIGHYENILLIRSYTKLFGLPGIRMGYAAASAKMIGRLRRHLPEWNVSAVSGRVMEKCAELERAGNIFDAAQAAAEREYLSRELTALGLTVYRSDTVFLLVKSGPGLYEKLLERGVLIRDCADFRGLSRGFCRIAVKDRLSNEMLVRALRDILS